MAVARVSASLSSSFFSNSDRNRRGQPGGSRQTKQWGWWLGGLGALVVVAVAGLGQGGGGSPELEKMAAG
jgi:hypothetical protein